MLLLDYITLTTSLRAQLDSLKSNCEKGTKPLPLNFINFQLYLTGIDLSKMKGPGPSFEQSNSSNFLAFH